MSETDINKWLHEVGIYNGSADTHDCIKIIKIQAEALDKIDYDYNHNVHNTIDIDELEEAIAKVEGIINNDDNS